MSTHTAGPWQVESDGRGPYVVGSEGFERVCTIECQAFKANGGPVDWANARLIAAAPALLAACRLAVVRVKEEWSKQTEGSDLWPLAEALRAAIDRAEGGSR